MNLQMFKKVMKQAKVKIDLSESPTLLPDTIKIIKSNDIYKVYKIDDQLNKTFIIETNSQNVAFKSTIKFLQIKLDHHGRIMKNNPTRR